MAKSHKTSKRVTRNRFSRSRKPSEFRSRSVMASGFLECKPDILPQRLKSVSKNTFTFSNMVSLSAVTSSGTIGAETNAALQFNLNQLDGVAAIQGMFDQYRIRQVSVTFEPQINMSTGSASAPGTLYTALDYDDATATTSTLLRQKETCMSCTGNQGVTRTLRPRIAVAAYSGAFTSFANMSEQWIDVASPSVQHFGVKWALVPMGGPGGFAAALLYATRLFSWVFVSFPFEDSTIFPLVFFKGLSFISGLCVFAVLISFAVHYGVGM